MPPRRLSFRLPASPCCRSCLFLSWMLGEPPLYSYPAWWGLRLNRHRLAGRDLHAHQRQDSVVRLFGRPTMLMSNFSEVSTRVLALCKRKEICQPASQIMSRVVVL